MGIVTAGHRACTFTTTSQAVKLPLPALAVPSAAQGGGEASTAACTCATEAAASGVASTLANASPSRGGAAGARRSSRRSATRTSRHGRGGIASHSRLRRRVQGGGRNSSLLAMICAVFTK